MAKRKKLIKDRYSFPGGQVVVFTLAFAVVGVIALTSTFAAPRGGGGGKTNCSGCSLSVKMVTDNNNNGLPNWNDTITFNIVDPNTTAPHVEVLCYQNSTLVYSATGGFFAGYPWPWSVNMPLASDAWKSGAADCTANLYHIASTHKTSQVVDYVLNFHVGA